MSLNNQFKFKKVTSVNFKPIGSPLTQLEKLAKMRTKNPVLDKFIEAFDLDLEL